MILVCPSCDSKFKVPDNAIPPEGRKVRCAQCGHVWHATRAHELKPTAAPATAAARAPAAAAFTPPVAEVDAGAAAKAAAIRRSVVSEEENVTAPDPDENLFDEGIEGAPVAGADHDLRSDATFTDEFDGGGLDQHDYEADVDHTEDDADQMGGEDEDFDDFDEDDILARRRGDLHREAVLKARARNQLLLNIGWGSLVVFVLALLGALFFMKDTVTGAFPGTNQLYDFFAETQAEALYQPEADKPLSKPITETEVYVRAGLIRDRMRIETVDGQSQVVIVGQLENTGQRAANVPKVEISIKDGRGRVLDQWVFDPPGLVLRRLSSLSFETTRPVPDGMMSVEVKPLEGTKSDNRAPSQL